MTVENDKQLNVSFSSWISLLNPGLSSIPLGLGTLVTIAAFLLFNTGTAWNEETPLTCKIPLADSAATYFDFVSPFIRALTTHIDNFPDWQPDTWRFAIYDAKAAVKKITQKLEEEQDQIVEQIWKTISNGAHSINMNKLVEQANLKSIPGAAEKLEYYLGTNELNLEKTKLALKIGAKCVGEIEMRGSFSDILAEHKVCVQEAIDGREVRELEEEGVNIWTSSDLGEKNWNGITSSGDGKNLAAVVSGGNIWTSIDSGAKWTERNYTQNWNGITSAGDGKNLAAVVKGGNIWTSSDFGAEWTERIYTRNWNGITSSGKGDKLAAVVSGGNIWTSIDSGATWTDRNYPQNWIGITSAGDGDKLAAVVSGGSIWTSSDSGAQWTSSDLFQISAGVRTTAYTQNWNGITSSGNGDKLAAVVLAGKIWTATPAASSDVYVFIAVIVSGILNY